MARALGHVRKPPRAWTKIIDSVEAGFLTDSATILRRVKTAAGTDASFGTPTSADHEYGPYAAKLQQKSANDQRQPDRHTVETSYVLSIASDVEPSEGDRVAVVEQGGRKRIFRVPGTVNARRSAWGTVPIWNVELEETREA